MLPKETISNLPAKKESFITGMFKIGDDAVVKIDIDNKTDNYHQFIVIIQIYSNGTISDRQTINPIITFLFSKQIQKTKF